MPASAKIQAETLDQFVAGWKSWNADNFLATWSKDCTQHTLPFSSGIAPRTRADTERIFPILMSTLTNFQLEVTNTVHDAEKGQAAVYAVTSADSPIGPYANEHALFVWFDEEGRKVNRIEEMFDADFMNGFLPRFHAYMAEKLKAQGQHDNDWIH